MKPLIAQNAIEANVHLVNQIFVSSHNYVVSRGRIGIAHTFFKMAEGREKLLGISRQWRQMPRHFMSISYLYHGPYLLT